MATSLNSNLNALFEKLESFVTTKTVIGEAIHFGEVIIVPLVDVSLGVGACASDKGTDKGESGGGGLGARITPSAVLVVMNGTVQLVSVKNQGSVNKLIDLVPGILSKLDFGFMKKKDEDKSDVFKEEVITE